MLVGLAAKNGILIVEFANQLRDEGVAFEDAILEAAEKAGGRDGLVGYLHKQAIANPQVFIPLLGKVLPMQVTGVDEGAIEINVTVGGNAGQP
jgi:hypothetical protein